MIFNKNNKNEVRRSMLKKVKAIGNGPGIWEKEGEHEAGAAASPATACGRR
jgi:hypothetical protein